MKKRIKLIFLSVFFLSVIGLGAFRAYDTYASDTTVEDELLSENVEALSAGSESSNDNEMVCLKGNPYQICWKRAVVSNLQCEYKNCRYIIEDFDKKRSKICYRSAGTVTRKYAREHNLETMYFSDQKCTHPNSDVTRIGESLHGQRIAHHTIAHPSLPE